MTVTLKCRGAFGLLVAVSFFASLPGIVSAEEPSEPRLREGWKWMVTIPEVNREETAVVLTNGNAVVKKIKYRHIVPESRILQWVEKGWLNVRRTSWDDELEWQVVLAQASDPQRPVIKIDEQMSSLELSYRGYYVREHFPGKLRIHREAKSADSPEWAVVKFEPWEFQRSQGFGSLSGTFESDYWTWIQAGPTNQRRDLWLRFSGAAGMNKDGSFGVRVSNFGRVLDELSDDQARAHVEADLLIATRRTIGAAEAGLTGKPLQARLGAEAAPALSASSWLNTEKPLAIDQLKDKFVLIGFWSGWSESSLKKLRQMEVLHNQFGARGVQVIGVHAAHKADNVADLLRKHGVTFPVMIDEPSKVQTGYVPGETASRYRVQSLPTFFLIDTEGSVSIGYGMAPPPKELIEGLLTGTGEP